MSDGLERINYDDYMPSTQGKSVQTESMVGRQMQEVKGMIFMAKQFPRDTYESFNRLMKACDRQILAESATYEYPRGDKRVTGPSIRLAEVAAQNWGNIDFGVVELEQKNGESTAMSYAWDLETNVRQTKIFVVKHERYSKNKGLTRLTDPRDIYEMVANQGARRLRACILGVIPGDVIDKAIERCHKTLIGNNTTPLEDRLKEVLSALEKAYSVTIEMVEKHFGYKIQSFTEMDLVKLKSIGTSLKDGMAKREDYFDIRLEGEKSSKIEDDFKEEGDKGGTDSKELPLKGSK
jgi:hypothetical protein